MGVTPPGWYEDQDDAALARWWDGDRWTEHTLVIADQVPNVQPPPPAGYGRGAGSEAFLEDEDDWNRLDEDDQWGDQAADDAETSVYAPIPVPGGGPSAVDPGAAAPTSVFSLEDEPPPMFGGSWEVQEPLEPRRGRDGWADQLRDLPPWARIALPVAAVLLLVMAVAASGILGGDDGGGGDDDGTTTTTILDPVRVRSAALLAVRVADVPTLTTSTFTELIPLTCEAARTDETEEVVDEIEQLRLDDPTLDRLLVGLEAGAEDYCPRDMAANEGLIDELYRTLGVVRSGTTVLATTSSSSTSSTSSTTTTTRATTTTRRTTTTTRPATTTTVPSTTTTASTTTTTTVPTDGGTDGTDGGIDLPG